MTVCFDVCEKPHCLPDPHQIWQDYSFCLQEDHRQIILCSKAFFIYFSCSEMLLVVPNEGTYSEQVLTHLYSANDII